MYRDAAFLEVPSGSEFLLFGLILGPFFLAEKEVLRLLAKIQFFSFLNEDGRPGASNESEFTEFLVHRITSHWIILHPT